MTEKPSSQTLHYYNFFDMRDWFCNKYAIDKWEFNDYLFGLIDAPLNDTYQTWYEEFADSSEIHYSLYVKLMDEFGTGEIGERIIECFVSW